MTSRPHLSVTQMRTYLRCPLQYYFRYVCDLDTPPTAGLTLGRTIHSALEHNYAQKIGTRQDVPVDQLCDIYSQAWDQEAADTFFKPDESPGKLKDEGIQLLQLYHEQLAPKIQPREVEQGFLLDTGVTRRRLKGYLDLIDEQGTVIDHKTTKRSFAADAADKDLQLTAYAWAYRKLYGQNENGTRLDVLVRTKQPKTQQLTATREQADLDRFLRLLTQVERGIDEGIFYPNDNFMCGTCGHGDLCEEW